MPPHMVSFLGKRQDPDLLVISFEGRLDRDVIERIKTDYRINGMHRQIGPYKVHPDGEEIIYVRN